MPYQNIKVRRDGNIAIVTLSRPDASNCLNEAMAAEIREVCPDLDQEIAVRVIIFTGDGDVFSCGDKTTSDDVETGVTEGRLANLRVSNAIAGIQKPTLCVLNGDAIDQGLELALACDIRVADGGATLGLTQLSRGFMPWDGGTQRLPRVVGRSRALEMVFTSRILDAHEALSIGQVSYVVVKGQALEHALKLASTIAGYGPIASNYAKEAVLKGLDLTLEHGLRLEADLNIILQSTHDRAEGISSFLEKRPPQYEGR